MLKINGKEVDAAGKTVQAYLVENDYDPRVVVVELNEEILKRDLYESTVLNDGDSVEIVMFMGGGSK